MTSPVRVQPTSSGRVALVVTPPFSPVQECGVFLTPAEVYQLIAELQGTLSASAPGAAPTKGESK